LKVKLTQFSTTGVLVSGLFSVSIWSAIEGVGRLAPLDIREIRTYAINNKPTDRRPWPTEKRIKVQTWGRKVTDVCSIAGGQRCTSCLNLPSLKYKF